MDSTLADPLKGIKTRVVDAFERAALAGKNVNTVEVDLSDFDLDPTDAAERLAEEGYNTSLQGTTLTLGW